MGQKRVYKRVESLVEVEFMSDASGVTTIIRTKTRDISAGGLKVYLNYVLNPGDRMQLLITIPNTKKKINPIGEVVRSDLIAVVGDRGEEMLYATRFKLIKTAPEEKNAITRYVFDCRKEAQNAKNK